MHQSKGQRESWVGFWQGEREGISPRYCMEHLMWPSSEPIGTSDAPIVGNKRLWKGWEVTSGENVIGNRLD
jgi:hypothetical protein